MKKKIGIILIAAMLALGSIGCAVFSDDGHGGGHQSSDRDHSSGGGCH